MESIADDARRYAIVDEAMQREAAARLDTWTSTPATGRTAGTMTTFTPKPKGDRRGHRTA